MATYPTATPYNTDCVQVLGTVTETNCPKSYASEIRELYVSELDDSDLSLPKYFPTDPTDAASWAAVISADTAGIKKFLVQGSMSLPAENITEKGGNLIHGPRKWQLVLNHVDTSSDNYEFARTLQSGGKIFVWFKTYGDQLYGVTDVAAAGTGYHPYGILVDVRQWHPELPEGTNSIENINTVLEWEAMQAPPKIDSPI